MRLCSPRAWAMGLLLLAIGCDGPGGGAHAEAALSTVPAFALKDQFAADFDTSRLDGSIWVADFMFTSCTSICPRLTGLMADLQKRTQARGLDVKFLSISVDPETDSPDVLRAYAERFGVDQDGWVFATGDKGSIRRLVVDGFRLGLGDKTTTEHEGHAQHAGHQAQMQGEHAAGSGASFDIMHANRFVLIDRARGIRGYYQTDTGGMRQLERDLERLIAQR